MSGRAPGPRLLWESSPQPQEGPLTGTNAYWTKENQSYSGIDSASATTVSNISEIDTGVNYVSGTNSSGLRVVSLWTDGSTSLVLSAYAPGTHDCWSVIDLKAPATIWGQSLDLGTYYARDAGVAPGDCVAKGTAPTVGTLSGPQKVASRAREVQVVRKAGLLGRVLVPAVTGLDGPVDGFLVVHRNSIDKRLLEGLTRMTGCTAPSFPSQGDVTIG